MPSPEATYDSLFIVRRLEEALQGVSEGEVHLFAYLAGLLGLFKGRPIAEWGYRFTRTNSGSPYAADIAEALQDLQLGGIVHARSEEPVTVLSCSAEGRGLAATLNELVALEERRPYLEASCSSAAALPVAAIRRAIRMEPTLKSASGHAGPRELLSGPSLELLYDQFGALREVLGDNASDLLVPSSVWLAYLIEKGSELKT